MTGLLLSLAGVGLKALVLLAVAAVLAAALRGRSASLRAAVWIAALTGTLLLPVLTPLLPTWSVPVPAALAAHSAPAPQPSATPRTAPADRAPPPRPPVAAGGVIGPTAPPVSWPAAILAFWSLGALALLWRLGAGLWSMIRAVRRARPVTDPEWLTQLAAARSQVGCRRRVELLVSRETEVPLTLGVVRPVVVLPAHAHTWLDDRRRAVLLHELVHITRLDSPARLIARVARSVHWFNPLAWWAVRRLDLEQEMACDEEVVACGTRPSDYACHLLGIARAAVHRPALAVPTLEMARAPHLERRIMTLLGSPTHRRGTLAALAPALFIFALVPPLAAVQPGDPTTRRASPALRQVLVELREAEAGLEPHLDEIEALEREIRARVEPLERIEVEIDHDRLAAIEGQMQPYLERIEALEIDMEPFEARLESLEEELEQLHLHVEDGTLEEIQRQITEQIDAHLGQITSAHLGLDGLHQQVAAILREMEPLHEQLAALHLDLEPHHLELQHLHEAMEPLHEQMEAVHLQMEPLHERLERLGDRVHEAIRVDIEAVLRESVGPVTGPGAPLAEAAARIAEEAELRVHDDLVVVSASPREVRTILTDLLAPHRVGTGEGFQAAVAGAAAALSPLELTLD